MYLYHTQGHLAKNLKSPSQKLEKEAPDDNDSEGDDKQIITTSLPEPKNQLSFSVVTFSSPPPLRVFVHPGEVWKQHEILSWLQALPICNGLLVLWYDTRFPRLWYKWTSHRRLWNLQTTLLLKPFIFRGHFIVSSEIIIFHFIFINY